MSADWDRARRRYPLIDKAVDADVWVQFFKDNPEDLTKLLGTLYSILRPDTTPRKGGPRPRTRGSWQDIFDLLAPRYSNDPFPDALRELMGRHSLRTYAARIPMHPSVLHRLLTGEKALSVQRRGTNGGIDPTATMDRLAGIARAGGVAPPYFMEWRTLWVQQAVTAVLQERPNLSVTLMQQLAGVV